MGTYTGKTVIVTGAGTGLGRAAAQRFASEGANVTLVGRRAGKLNETLALISEAGGKAIAVQADVSLEADVKRIVKETVEAFGRIDILLNNAAVVDINPLIETPLDVWNTQISINLTGAFLMTRETIPYMRKQKFGRIVNVTSGLATNGAGGYAAYSASKAALESLTRTTTDEESEYGITALLFNPGTIRSEMHATGQEPAAVLPKLLQLLAPNAAVS